MNKLSIIIAFVLFAFIGLSCQNREKSNPQVSKYKIENYLTTVPEQYPEYKNNSVIREDLNSHLREDFKNQLNNGLLNDLPLQLISIDKCGEKYIANFFLDPVNKNEDHKVLKQIELDIYAETDEVTAKNLVEKSRYLISGKFQDYITFQTNDKYCATILRAPFSGYHKDISTEEIEFGAIGIQLDSIQEFRKLQ